MKRSSRCFVQKIQFENCGVLFEVDFQLSIFHQQLPGQSKFDACTRSFVKKEGSNEDISFAIVNVTPIGFKFAVHSTLEDFDKNEFDRIDICYFAFLKFDPDELVKHETDDDR